MTKKADHSYLRHCAPKSLTTPGIHPLMRIHPGPMHTHVVIACRKVANRSWAKHGQTIQHKGQLRCRHYVQYLFRMYHVNDYDLCMYVCIYTIYVYIYTYTYTYN